MVSTCVFFIHLPNNKLRKPGFQEGEGGGANNPFILYFEKYTYLMMSYVVCKIIIPAENETSIIGN